MSKRKSAKRAPLNVCELFAGVGGFRVGLEGIAGSERQVTKEFTVVASNQWEPTTKAQHASDVYVARWGSNGHSNSDIFELLRQPDYVQSLLDKKVDVLCGGFPCQDYSVAQGNHLSKGIEGKKGVLWWAIHDLLGQMSQRGAPIKYLFLENVDRLLKSPTKARGKDFAIILASLAQLGYVVEWRVVDASAYGFAQKRKRVFLVGFHESTNTAKHLRKSKNSAEWLTSSGTFARALPLNPSRVPAWRQVNIGLNVASAQEAFSEAKASKSVFENCGVMVDASVTTVHLSIKDLMGSVPTTLGDVVSATLEVPDDYYSNDDSIARWTLLKGAKREKREAANGFSYTFSEEALAFPDHLDRPSRTIITSEGGSGPSRTTHVVRDASGKLRRLVPEELEALNGFPRGFTAISGVSPAKRAFLMGNALVTGIVERIGKGLVQVIADT